MSFSTDVKEELVRVDSRDKHCRIAELSALVKYYGKVEKEPETRIILAMDNIYAARKCCLLFNKVFNIKTDIFDDSIDKPKTFVILNKSNTDIKKVLETLSPDAPMPLLNRDCCRRAYLRGAFIAGGFVGDPQGSYHFEMVSEEREFADLLSYLADGFDIKLKQSVRRKHYVSYLKSAESISDVLNVIGATKSMMDFVSARIVKDVRNDINRRNNYECANIVKAADAATRVIGQIMLIDDKVGLNTLPNSLREVAKLRIEHPDLSITELGKLLDPPVGKSGVNHRLRKLSEYAASLSDEREKE